MKLSERLKSLSEADIEREIEGLSSGTISTITGLKSNSDIDLFRSAFIDFAVNSDIIFKDWKDAFLQMARDFEFSVDAKGKAKAKDIKSKVF